MAITAQRKTTARAGHRGVGFSVLGILIYCLREKVNCFPDVLLGYLASVIHAAKVKQISSRVVGVMLRYLVLSLIRDRDAKFANEISCQFALQDDQT